MRNFLLLAVFVFTTFTLSAQDQFRIDYDVVTLYADGDWGPWERFVAVTIRGTANMLEAAQKAGVQRFLHVSSISAYGHPDGEGMVIDETAPLGVGLYKWSYYSRAKVQAETLAWDAHRKGDVPVTVVKPSWLYGPRDRASMPRLIRAIRAGKAKLLGDGTNRLNLTHAANEAEGCILAATADKALGQSYNLSNDGVITQGEYTNAIAKCLGLPPVTKKVPYSVAYNAAKSGLDHMARTIAAELARHRINVNVIQPGWIETPGEHKTFGAEAIREAGSQLPWGRIGQPEDIGRVFAGFQKYLYLPTPP